MPSDALKALARAHAARIVSGDVSPSDGARAIWTDVFYHLEPGDHFADGFVFWGYEIDTAETDARRWFCEAAVLNLARRLVDEENGASAEPVPRARVTLDDLAAIRWLEPWRAVVSGLEVELKNEVDEGHVLYGRKAISVARRFDTDDVLFLLLEHPSPLAVVNLTWSSRKERNSQRPRTTLYASMEDFVERRMRADHKAHTGRGEVPKY